MRRRVVYKPHGASTSEIVKLSEPDPQRGPTSEPPQDDIGDSCLRVAAITGLVIVGLFSLCCGLPLLLLKPDTTIIDNVPIGSNLADLDSYIDVNNVGHVLVYEYLPAEGDKEVTQEHWDKRYSEDYFLMTENWANLGEYRLWDAPPDVRSNFTGSIQSYSIGSLYGHSFGLEYYEGELQDKWYNTWID